MQNVGVLEASLDEIPVVVCAHLFPQALKPGKRPRDGVSVGVVVVNLPHNALHESAVGFNRGKFEL